MAKKFEFRNNAAELNIAGHMFKIELTAEVIAASDEIRDGAAKHAENLEKSGVGAKEIVEKTCVFLSESIDRLLGEGAVQTIFGERKITMLDLADVLGFIQSEIYGKISEFAARNVKK